MPWTAEELYYRDLPDDAFVAAYLSYLETYRLSRGRDRDSDLRKIQLIADVARQTGRYEMLERAVAARKQQRAESATELSE